MMLDLNAKHGCVSCSSNLGSVLRSHSFRQGESPVCPGIRKGQHLDIFDQVASTVYLSEAWFHIYPKRQNYIGSNIAKSREGVQENMYTVTVEYRLDEGLTRMK